MIDNMDLNSAIYWEGYCSGYKAWQDGEDISSNPYVTEELQDAWEDGYCEASVLEKN